MEQYVLPFDGYVFDEYAKKAWDEITNGNKCVYISGGAGCGKSSFLKFLRANYTSPFVVCAPTGVAAVNVDGVTLHSFFWLKPYLMKESDINFARGRDDVIQKMETLIIDEISMCSPATMDIINRALQKWRHNNKPFGGVNLILFGDLYQLPVVVTDREADYYRHYYPNGPFFFNANVFDRMAITTIEFKNSYRQKEGKFLDLLNNIRLGVNVADTITELNSLCVKTEKINAPVLTATNARRDAINETRFDKIDSPEICYEAVITGNLKDDERFPSPRYLSLKVGAYVMVTKNNPLLGTVNGDLGVVTAMHPDSVDVALNKGVTVRLTKNEWQTYKYKFNKEEKHMDVEKDSSFSQIPLVLAFAFSIHKSQGITLDKAIIELGRGAFAYGQTYVALSRLRTLEGLTLKRELTMSDIKVDPRVTEFYGKSLSSEQPMKFNIEEISENVVQYEGKKTRSKKVQKDAPDVDNVKKSKFDGLKVKSNALYATKTELGFVEGPTPNVLELLRSTPEHPDSTIVELVSYDEHLPLYKWSSLIGDWVPVEMKVDAVPTWCEHIKFNMLQNKWMVSGAMEVPADVNECMFCKARRP